MGRCVPGSWRIERTLGARWQDLEVVWRALPFGWNEHPFIDHTLSEHDLAQYIRSKGISVLACIEDSWVVCRVCLAVVPEDGSRYVQLTRYVLQLALRTCAATKSSPPNVNSPHLALFATIWYHLRWSTSSLSGPAG